MKNVFTFILLPVVSLIFSSCSSTYEQNLNKEMKIPYVYLPPNNAYQPYTLLQYTKDGGFQQICDATIITGLTHKEIEEKKAVNEIADMSIKKNHTAKFEIDISKNEIGNADINYSYIKTIELSLENGKQVSIPSLNISDIYNNIDSSKCKNNIKIFASEVPNSKFLIPMVVFSYDLNYYIKNKNGVDITAELSKELTKIVLGKIGINYSQDKDLNMSSKNLYIGFRGIEKKVHMKNTSEYVNTMNFINTSTLSNISKSFDQKFILEDGNDKMNSEELKNATLDVTEIVQKISKE